jgi:cobalamin biosynthesis protein CobW
MSASQPNEPTATGTLAVTVFVCTSCRRAAPTGAIERPGGDLVGELSRRFRAAGAEDVMVTGVECLAVCKRPCTVAVTADACWTYLVGDLDPAQHTDDIVSAVLAYRHSGNGIVPWSERPIPFRRGVIARVPPLGFMQPAVEPVPDSPKMTSLAKVPCSIITGFLGAGKTTLVRHVLQNARGRRLAVIVNEFGDVGIDGEILKDCGSDTCSEDRIVELSNGCICCTVADDFVPALEGLLKLEDPPEHILIETSGLALPKPLVQAFNWPAIASRVTVDGVIAVVDGAAVAAGRFADDPQALAAQRGDDASIEHDNPLEEVYEDQLLCADLIVLNKTDLIDAANRKRVVADIKAAVPRAVKVVEAESSRLDPSVLLGLAAAAEADLAARPSHHDQEEEHDHDDFESFIVEIPDIEQPAEIVERIAGAAAAHDILRVKGFAHIKGKPMRLLIQGVGPRIQQQFDRAWRPGESRRGQLVVIGQKGLNREAIARAIAGE